MDVWASFSLQEWTEREVNLGRSRDVHDSIKEEKQRREHVLDIRQALANEVKQKSREVAGKLIYWDTCSEIVTFHRLCCVALVKDSCWRINVQSAVDIMQSTSVLCTLVTMIDLRTLWTKRKMLHNSPWQASYAVSIVSIWQKISAMIYLELQSLS